MNTSVKYGLFLTATTIVWIAFMGTIAILDYIYPVAQVVVLYLGIKEYKEKTRKGKMTLQQGIREGVAISLVYGLFSFLTFFFYYTLINPDALRLAKRMYGLTGFSNTSVILANTASQFLLAVVGGFFVSLIVSYFLAKKS